MATPTEQIALQNEEYRQSLFNDIQSRNERVVQLMDATVAQQESELSSQRLTAMNSFSPSERRRLMGGEKLEDIIGDKFKKSKYYNTSDEAANAIPKDELFVYQIGEHLMAYETKDISLNHELKTIDFPIVVYDPETQEYSDATYTVQNEDVFEILKYQLEPPTPTPTSPVGFEYFSSTDSEHTPSNPSSPQLPFQYELDDSIPDWVKEDYENESPFSDSLPTVGGYSSPSPSAPQVPPTPSSPQYNVNDSYRSRDPLSANEESIRKIQGKLFEQLLSIYQGESAYSSQVYTPQMEDRINEMLRNNYFPFQIVNNLISEFTM